MSLSDVALVSQLRAFQGPPSEIVHGQWPLDVDVCS